MNSENSKTSHPNRLSHNLINKADLQKCEKSVALSNLSIYYLWKNKKKAQIKTVNLKYLKTENRITFKIKLGYYLELLMPETIRLLENTKNENNDGNVLHLEMNKVTLVH